MDADGETFEARHDAPDGFSSVSVSAGFVAAVYL